MKIHHCKTQVGEILWTKEECDTQNSETANCKTISDDGRQHLSVCFDGQTHGLIFANLARGAKKGSCQLCKSVKCSHVRMWDKEFKEKVIKVAKKSVSTNVEELAATTDSVKAASDESTEEYTIDDDDDDDVEATKAKLRLMFPFEDKLRQVDSANYSELCHLISEPSGEECVHGHKWSDDDPKAQGWIYSNSVKIAHSSYVAVRERTAYYRKTVGKCDCKLVYDGLSDLLVPVSRGQNKYTGKPFNLVSISLLTDYLTDFLQNGTPMRGFYRSYQSKCLMKYGMVISEVISWRAFHTACVIFLEDILSINKMESFTCSNCGPRPPILVFDGISMGIQQSQLIQGEDRANSNPNGNSEIVGSNFQDRMFIKLSSNRKILREAVKDASWPKPEVGKLNNRQVDTGMQHFWDLVSLIKTNEKPSKGALLLMESLSTSSSTLGLTQIVEEELFAELLQFLRGGKTFLKGTECLDLHVSLRREYPVLIDILLGLCDEDGCLPKPFRL